MEREISKIIMTKNSYHTVGSANQHSIIDIASFVCMDKRTLVKTTGVFSGMQNRQSKSWNGDALNGFPISSMNP
jgi:hypothetical protein